MFQQNTVQQQEFVVPHQPKYEFKLTTQNIIKTKTLIIALYGPASLFAHSLLSNASPVARINFLKTKQTSLADIYVQSNKDQGFIIFNGQPQKMKEIYFTQFIQKNFKYEKVIILTHEYAKNLQNDSNSCLLYLKTSSWIDQIHCNKYKQGLMGLTADILISSQIDKVPGCCFVGIFKDYQLNKQIILQVFGKLIGKQGLQQKSDISDKIKKYNMKKYSNNLYL